MVVEQELVDLLICPNCKGPIEYRQEQESIVCIGECRLQYPVVNGIPHMLVDEAKQAAG